MSLGEPDIVTFREILELVMEYSGKQRLLINQPRPFAKLAAIFTPSSILTLDQIELLKHDNIVGKKALNFENLEIEPKDIESIVPTYLGRYKGYNYGNTA